jgi:hypothetical protein
MIAARPYSFTRRQLQFMGLEPAPAVTTLRPVHLPAELRILHNATFGAEPFVDEWFATEDRITPDPVGENINLVLPPHAPIKVQTETAEAAWLNRLWTLKHAAIKSYGKCSYIARQAALNFDERYAQRHELDGE